MAIGPPRPPPIGPSFCAVLCTAVLPAELRSVSFTLCFRVLCALNFLLIFC